MRTCFYAILNIPTNCSQDDLKKAFRKQALLNHPDKNPTDRENATARFQAIQEAYETLSNPEERAWYDGHKNDFLRTEPRCDFSGADGTEYFVDTWPFCHMDAFADYTDSYKGFYTVYNRVFASIDALEVKWSQKTLPQFGDTSSPADHVLRFYRLWNEFVTRSPALHAAKWRLSDAPNSKIRKIMEQENKKCIEEAKKEYQSNVRILVNWVRRRDPRLIRIQREKANQVARKNEAIIEAKLITLKKHRLLMDAAHEEERRKAGLRRIEIEKLKGEGQLFCDYSDEEEIIVKPKELFPCIPCKKTFKSVNLFNDHCKSKKHIKAAAAATRPTDPMQLNPAKIVDEEATQGDFEPSPTIVDEEAILDEEIELLLQTLKSRDRNDSMVFAAVPDTLIAAVPENLDAAAPDTLIAAVPETLDAPAPDNLDSAVPDTLVAAVPENLDAAAPDNLDYAVPDNLGAAVPDNLDAAPEEIAKKRRRKPKSVKTATQWQCSVCGQSFETRNRMFRHIEAEGHAALKKR